MLPIRSLASTVLSRRLWVGRLALLLALFGALAPTVSHALNWARGEAPSLIEVCTNDGPRWMALGQPVELQSEVPNKPDAATVFEHCPFCLHHADRVLPPSRTLSQGFGSVGEPVTPTIGQSFLFITLPARVPPPRGPPASRLISC